MQQTKEIRICFLSLVVVKFVTIGGSAIWIAGDSYDSNVHIVQRIADHSRESLISRKSRLGDKHRLQKAFASTKLKVWWPQAVIQFRHGKGFKSSAFYDIFSCDILLQAASILSAILSNAATAFDAWHDVGFHCLWCQNITAKSF